MSTITVKDGMTIYYKDWGKGPVVTFSHGWPLSSDAWDQPNDVPRAICPTRCLWIRHELASGSMDFLRCERRAPSQEPATHRFDLPICRRRCLLCLRSDRAGNQR